MIKNKEFAFGVNVETQFAELARSKYKILIPMQSRHNNVSFTSAPMLLAQESNIISPDFLALGDVWNWIEVKAKKQASYHRNNQRLEHGIDYNHFLNYQKIQKITEVELLIVIYEEDKAEWLSIPLNEAVNYGDYRKNFPGDGGGWLFPRSAMETFF